MIELEVHLRIDGLVFDHFKLAWREPVARLAVSDSFCMKLPFWKVCGFPYGVPIKWRARRNLTQRYPTPNVLRPSGSRLHTSIWRLSAWLFLICINPWIATQSGKKMTITSSQGTGRAKTHLIQRKCCCSEERQRQNTFLKERPVSVEGEVKCLWNLLCELVQGHFHWVFLKGIKCTFQYVRSAQNQNIDCV